ncbi:hypothetical protein EDD68_10538 [Melghiribacillus thermohalophilus]|uniref:Uncharacterized protein n=1 Tax=Melghiribacillus thermohalophilus TaxID=1324956 RepID=A0A4R3N8N0_9BACI|nr:hypothetical protein [Melghiribacillus thermohalophilus]TCT24586.1 hypothetical protein EDD68_10538 [Melghiribacillus thermohalophilus]
MLDTFALIGFVFGIAALTIAGHLQKKVNELERRIRSLERKED